MSGVSLDNIHFSKEINANIKTKNRIIITNFDHAYKFEGENFSARQSEDLSLVPSLLLSLYSDADVSEFVKEIAKIQESNYAKLTFLLKKQILPNIPDIYYSWERKPVEAEIH